MRAEILPLDARNYEPHALHRGERIWMETNCYVDLWIEALHAFGFDPTASLPFTVAADFEGDQWLFYKQPNGDLLDLYGVDIQELNIWRNLADVVVEQVSRGRLVMVEMDTFHLPDTTGVSYHLTHTKTTVGIQSIDTEARTLGYFHNASYYALEGDDFQALFGLDRERRADELVPYTEFAKVLPRPKLSEKELVEKSKELLRKHLAKRPAKNPVAAFRSKFENDVAWLLGQPQEMFHLYAFATLRQCGSCFELAASYVRWLTAHGERGLETAAISFEILAGQSKAVQFKAARAVMLKRNVDFTALLDSMQAAWESALSVLSEKYGR